MLSLLLARDLARLRTEPEDAACCDYAGGKRAWALTAAPAGGSGGDDLATGKVRHRRYPCAAGVEALQRCQTSERREVGNLGVADFQYTQLAQARERGQVGDPGAGELQGDQVAQLGDRAEVGDL